MKSHAKRHEQEKKKLSRAANQSSSRSPNGAVGAAIYQEMFATAPAAILITNKEGKCVAANPAALTLLGLRSAEVLRSSLDSLFGSPAGTAGQLHELSSEGSRVFSVTYPAKGGKNIELDIELVRLKTGHCALALQPRAGIAVQPKNIYKSSSFLSQFLAADSIDGEGYYQTIIQHFPYGVGIVADGLLVMANPMFAKILGYRSSDQIIGKNVAEFVERSSKKFFTLLLQRQLRGESVPTKFETRMLRADESAIEVETSFTLGSYRGELALNLTISDITLRKELEKRLTDSERLFKNVVNSMVDALVITDLQGKVLDVNDEFERLTGFSRQESVHATIPYPWIHDEDLRMYMTWLDGLRGKTALRDFDITWVNKAGRRIAVSLNTTLLLNASGDPMVMVNIARDITDRQTARQALSQQLRRLEVLYDLSRTLGGTLDPKEIARLTFNQVKKVIPVDAFYIDFYEEETNRVWAIMTVDVVDGEQRELAPDSSAKSLTREMASYHVVQSRKPLLELRKVVPRKPINTPFGSVERASASLMHVPMFSKDKVIGILSAQSYDLNAYSKDHLTLLESIANLAAIGIEKANLYQETVTKSLQIEARNKELDDFTYVVSHDLKEPLISVEGYAKILKQDYLQGFDAAGREYLKSIIDSCGQMKKLIEDLLQLSRVGKLAEERVPLDLQTLLRQVLEELQYTIRERKAEVNLRRPLPMVYGVDAHLKIVFRNLISNAIKFNDSSVPTVMIAASVEENVALIEVQDNGIGIEEEYFEKIFMIFQRLHKKEEFEGTGAGLTIVKKIIEAHGGHIWVTSRPGQGSTFHFTLPLS